VIDPTHRRGDDHGRPGHGQIDHDSGPWLTLLAEIDRRRRRTPTTSSPETDPISKREVRAGRGAAKDAADRAPARCPMVDLPLGAHGKTPLRRPFTRESSQVRWVRAFGAGVAGPKANAACFTSMKGESSFGRPFSWMCCLDCRRLGLEHVEREGGVRSSPRPPSC